MVAEDMLPRIAILMAHTGGGHLSAARSLAEALDARARVTIISLVDDYVDFPWNAMSVAYGPWVNYAPWLYHLIYRAFDSRKRVEFTYRAAYPLVRREVAAAFAPDWPDVVVTVHPLQTEIPLRVLRELGNPAPFITVVTDPVTPPVAWFCPEVDLTIVATEPAKRTAMECGVPADRIRILGLPVRQAFASIWGRPKPGARAQLGLDPDRPMALLTGGGAGIGKLLPLARAIARSLAKASHGAQMAIIAGRNQILKKQLQSAPWPVPVKVLGFVEDMPNWLAAADLLITKAGPGTLAVEDGLITWIDWASADTELLEFTKSVSALRAAHPVFRRRRFFSGKPLGRSGQEGLPDIAWFTPEGTEMKGEDWGSGFAKSVAVFLNGHGIPDRDTRGQPVTDDSFVLFFNAHYEPLEFTLPPAVFGKSWEVVLSTDGVEPGTVVAAAESVTIDARATAVLQAVPEE